MAQDKTFVDYGNTSVEFGFHFNPTGMNVGDSKYLSFSPEEVLSHVGVVNADLINPHKMEIMSTKTNGLFGISAYHGEKDNWVKSSNSTAVLGDHLDAQHHHVNIPFANHTSTVFLRPSFDQSVERNKITNRKAIPLWAGMTSANVKAGVYVSKLGDEKRFIVTPGATDVNGNVTTKGAMHAYIQRNARNPDFAGGKFAPGKATMTNYNGVEGYVVKPEMFEPMHSMIKDMVETHSGFNKGFGVALTKLCDQPTSSPMNVRVLLHRTPMTKTEGLVPTMDRAVSESHVRTLVNGGVPVASEMEADAAAVQLPGFEDKLKIKGIDTSAHTIEDFDGSE